MINEIKNNQPDDTVRIEYMLGNLCNHKCHYCFPGSNEGDAPWPDLDLVKKNLSHLLNHYRSIGKTKSNIFLVGGEPTLWKGLEELCLHLKQEHDVIIEMSTNGTRKVNWWKKNAINFDHIGVSVHREFANISHLIEVCDVLYESGSFVNADVMIDPTAFDECVDIVEQLKESKYKWPIIAKVVNFDGLHRYTDTQLKYFEESIKRYPLIEWYEKTTRKPQKQITIIKDNDDIINIQSDSWLTRNNLNYFKGWMCNLGVDFIKIFADGSITGNCQQSILGNHNLYDKNFVNNFYPNITPVRCTKSICVCNEEMICNKRKLSA